VRLLNRDRVEPTEDASRREARAAHRREQRLRVAMRSGWPELNRSDLIFTRYTITHTPSGTVYRAMLGEVATGGPSPVAAYYVDAVGDPVFLEPA
jgi:hypothetical protein